MFREYISKYFAQNWDLDGYVRFAQGYYDRENGFDSGRYLVKFPELNIIESEPSGVVVTNIRFLGGDTTNRSIGTMSSILKDKTCAIAFDIMTPIAKSLRESDDIVNRLDELFLNMTFSETDFVIYPDMQNPRSELQTPASNSDIYSTVTLTYRFNLMYI